MTILNRIEAVSGTGPGFDQVRLAAAMVVVAHHSWWGVNDFLFTYSNGFIQFGLLAVIVFFCLSGFLVTPGLVRNRSAIIFATHRLLRIFPALVVIVLISMFALGPVFTTYSIRDYLYDPQLFLYAKNAVTLTSHFLPGITRDGEPLLINGALWSLHFELLSYIFLAILSILGALRHRTFLVVVLFVSYLFYIAAAFHSDFTAILSSRFITFINLFVYFMAGVVLFLFSDRIPHSATLAAGAFILILVSLPLGFGAVVLPVCVTYITIYLGLCTLPGRAFIKRDISYGVYLIHSPVIGTFLLLFPGLQLGWRLFLIVLPVTIIAASLSWTFVEEPSLRHKKVVSKWICRQFSLISRTTPLADF